MKKTTTVLLISFLAISVIWKLLNYPGKTFFLPLSLIAVIISVGISFKSASNRNKLLSGLVLINCIAVLIGIRNVIHWEYLEIPMIILVVLLLVASISTLSKNRSLKLNGTSTLIVLFLLFGFLSRGNGSFLNYEPKFEEPVKEEPIKPKTISELQQINFPELNEPKSSLFTENGKYEILFYNENKKLYQNSTNRIGIRRIGFKAEKNIPIFLNQIRVTVVGDSLEYYLFDVECGVIEDSSVSVQIITLSDRSIKTKFEIEVQ